MSPAQTNNERRRWIPASITTCPRQVVRRALTDRHLQRESVEKKLLSPQVVMIMGAER
jgi:hypothetical protein